MDFRVGRVIGGMALGLALAGSALAQVPSASQNGFQPPFQAKEKPVNREPIPPALPGAESTPDEAAHANGPVDLPPTDALFDAINRGDIAEARDALSRGADVQGHNVLGMTPIALSVDLARNDITFLLLSYRGTGSAAPPATRSAGSSSQSGKSGKSVRTGTAAERPATRDASEETTNPVRRTPVRRSVPTPATAAIAPSGQPGTPVPQAGFLGFGG